MIEVVAAIVAAGVVANPFAVGMNVRCVGMPALVVEMTIFRRRMRISHRRGSVGWDMPATNFTVVLGKGCEGT
jgi:hypothetical protein